VHGSAVMNSLVANSKILRKNIDIDILATNYVTNTEKIGSFSIYKFILLSKYLTVLFLKLLFNKPNLVYFAINIYGAPFYRDALFVILIKLFRIKILYHLHGKGADINYYKHRKLYDFVYRNAFVICLSENLKKDIFFYTGSPYVINNGIPEIKFNSKTKDSQTDGIIRILYLSNFIKTKGVIDLLEASKILASKQYNFKIQLLGQYRGELTKDFFDDYISKNELDNYVEIVGPKFGKEKEEYFLNSDIFVFPTYNEAFGLVILEAMQYGLPVISTHEGSIPEIIEDGITGILIKKRDINALVDKISLLISNKDLRKQMGKRGQLRFKENYTETIFEENLVRIFKQILNI